ncbi:MAG: potassium-transporting ATPase subunit KdpB, partial [Acetobacteraceae bacterium]
LLVTVLGARNLAGGQPAAFALAIAAGLWLTVLFATFAEAVAEGRGRARAESLRRARSDTMAKVLLRPDDRVLFKPTPASTLERGELVLVEAGDLIPSDGEVVEGIASVNESAVTGGTQVVSDWLVIRITADPGSTFLDRMIGLVEGASRRKTPNEIALDILLAGLTIIFLIAVVTLVGLARYSDTILGVPVLSALLVTLIPTTIGGLLSAIGIAGMDRLVRFNVVATSGRAVEAAGDVDTLLLDKTGTITFGNRMAAGFAPAPGVSEADLAEAAVLASLGDDTPEGRSILTFARDRYAISRERPIEAAVIAFSATTRLSGLDHDGRSWRKGAVDSVLATVRGSAPAAFTASVERIARSGGTPLAVALGGRLMGVIELKDIVKPGIRDRFDALRRMGIRTIMVTGDNRLTAAAIATEAGVDDFIAEATPQDKLDYIRKVQAEGRLVAMAGDGTNDAPALAQADVGVAMQTGTQAAREAGNMVDLDSDPTKLIEVVEIGKQLLITRGALTTFSIANDVSKYFAILPAIFVLDYPGLQALNIMRLTSPQSAILSAVIFNALIIVALVPLALRGVRFRAVGAAALLRRNLLIYGLGGIAAPFIGIKIIDMILSAFGLA